MILKSFRIAAFLLLGIVLSTAICQAAPLKFPIGPSGTGRFGAYYAKLLYGSSWDTPWRVGPQADVVVRFDGFNYRLIFWRGTSYVPCWVNNNGKWYTDSSVRRASGDVKYDKLCTYAHARIVESSDARVVVHWRYASLNSSGALINTDSITNWNDWVDEFYIIYPDGMGVRRMKLFSSSLTTPIYCQQSTVINEPNTTPESNIALAAVTLVNLNGDSQTYSWATTWPVSFPGPSNPAIQIINLNGTGSANAFQIVQPTGASFAPVARQTSGGNFNKLTDWPLIGTTDPAYDKPSYSPISTITWSTSATEKGTKSWMMMTGLTTGSVADLATIAKSWLQPANLAVTAGSYTTTGFNQGDRAYGLACGAPGSPTALTIRLDGTSGSPIYNPAFVITGWGKRDCSLKINGVPVSRGPAFRYGYRKTAAFSDLIVWVQTQATTATILEIIPT